MQAPIYAFELKYGRAFIIEGKLKLPHWDSGRLRLTCNQDAYAHRRFESGMRLKFKNQ